MKKLKTKPTNPIIALRYKKEGDLWIMKLNQIQLAFILKTTQSSLSKIESEKAKPETDLLEQISQVFGKDKTFEVLKYFTNKNL